MRFKREKNWPAVVSGVVIAVIVAALLAWGLSAQPAKASPLTSVRNIGTLSQIANPSVTVLKDNGTYVTIAAGQTLWGVRAVRIGKGQCIRIDGNPERCAIDRSAYNVDLGFEKAYTVQRTR